MLGIASVGSLKVELGVGTFVAPDDFIALHLGVAYTDTPASNQTPGFDLDWRRAVLDAWAAHSDVAVVDGGVYWQAIGPRFETPAEIRLMAVHADLVGMTTPLNHNNPTSSRRTRSPANADCFKSDITVVDGEFNTWRGDYRPPACI